MLIRWKKPDDTHFKAWLILILRPHSNNQQSLAPPSDILKIKIVGIHKLGKKYVAGKYSQVYLGLPCSVNISHHNEIKTVVTEYAKNIYR